MRPWPLSTKLIYHDLIYEKATKYYSEKWATFQQLSAASKNIATNSTSWRDLIVDNGSHEAGL